MFVCLLYPKRNVYLCIYAILQYESATENFNNIDILIDSINNGADYISALAPEFDAINAFYSTPEMYTRYKYNEFIRKGGAGQKKSFEASTSSSRLSSSKQPALALSIKTDDFFPYSDCPHCFWTGYFTSRPGLKKLERVGSSFLHAVRQIQTLFGNNAEQMRHSADIYNLETAMGIAQHHDAVSGTSKQHVAYDYAKKIQTGINGAAKFAANIIRSRLVKSVEGNNLSDLSYCQHRNVSVCHISQVSSACHLPVYAVGAIFSHQLIASGK